MSKEIVSFPITSEKADELMAFYLPYQKLNNGEYIVFQAEYSGVIITIYRDKKNKYKVVFSGDGALTEAKKWNIEAEVKEAKAAINGGWLCKDNQIGSDEVGVGDFLLPVIVVAAFVRGKDLKELESFGVKDSKKLTDEKIREIAPGLLKKFFVSKLSLPNEKYNELIAKGENMNSIKAKMHNRALNNLHKEYIDVIAIYVDQFVSEERYYSYLDKKDEPILKGISFKTKGESRFPSVAVASVIARYYFLLEKDKLEAKYDLEFPFGAGKKADEFKKILLDKVGQEEFDKLVKQNFKNYFR